MIKTILKYLGGFLAWCLYAFALVMAAGLIWLTEVVAKRDLVAFIVGFFSCLAAIVAALWTALCCLIAWSHKQWRKY